MLDRVTQALAGIGLGDDLAAATPDCPCTCWRVRVMHSNQWRTAASHTSRAAALADLAARRIQGITARITSNPKY